MTPGDRFAYLVVLSAAKPSNHMPRYRCRCACGKETVQNERDLVSGRVVSCGCVGRLRRIAALNSRNVRKTHEALLQNDRKAAAVEAQREAIGALYAMGRG